MKKKNPYFILIYNYSYLIQISYKKKIYSSILYIYNVGTYTTYYFVKDKSMIVTYLCIMYVPIYLLVTSIYYKKYPIRCST